MYKHRNLFLQFLFYILTFGLYGIYWYYSTAVEMKRSRKLEGDVVLWTILYIFPLINIISYWKHASYVEIVTERELNKVGLLVAAIIFYPVYWIIVQLALNSRSAAIQSSPDTADQVRN